MNPTTLSTALVMAMATAGAVFAGGSIVSVRAAAGGTVGELRIYGPIGESFWGDSVTAASVVEQLDQLNVATVNVRINSPGGSVTDGLAIYNALVRHPAKIIVTVDGQAASIASLIAMAGDDVVMPANSLLMVHAPYLYAGGNANDMRDFAERLDTHAAAMAESYIAKTGKREDVEAMLSDGRDHWFTAAEAIEFGFADRTEETAAEAPDDAAAAAALVGYLSAIAKAPTPIHSQLRGHIQAAASERVFTSLAEATQRAVVAHIEDPQMKQRFEAIIMANAAGGAAAPAATPVAAAPAPAAAAPAAPAATPTAADTRVAIIAAQRDRNTAILAASRAHATNPQIVALRDEALTDPDFTVDMFNARAMAILGSQATPAAATPSASAGTDERDQRRTAMAQAIDARLGQTQADSANPFRGFALREIARECAAAAGVNVRGMDPMEMVQAAITHSTSDFPYLLGNTVRRAVMAGYEEVPEVFPQFTRAISVPDFRKTSLAGLGNFIGITEVGENGEYKYGKFSDRGAEVQLKKLGGIFSISHEAIVNDDLNLLSNVPRKMGAAAKRALGDRVFALLTGNPKLADNVDLFHADHKNLATAAALSTATVDGLRALMAKQIVDGASVHVPLKYLLVPVGLGGLARQILASEFEIGGGKNLTAPNYMRGRFEVLEDPRLDIASATAFYGVADPAVADSIVIAYRDGVQEPSVSQKEGWNVDGIEFKVRLEAAAAIADHLGLAKNPGA
ncbi:ClpP-like prohead protease/major capsid protein fusion protein [Lysobacter olei]